MSRARSQLENKHSHTRQMTIRKVEKSEKFFAGDFHIFPCVFYNPPNMCERCVVCAKTLERILIDQQLIFRHVTAERAYRSGKI